jgi:hypothetical protein
MDQTILIFLGVALAILALALLLSRMFRKSIRREKHEYDINGPERQGAATWIGINKTSADRNEENFHD